MGVFVNKFIKLIPVIALPLVGQVTWAQSAEKEAQLEEVTVTAQRRAESLQDLSIMVTAIDGAEVEKWVNRPEELTSFTTQVNVAPSGGMTQIYIRGVGNLGGTAYAEGAVAFNVDQVYIARPTALDAVFFDLERVEILKGPQGTLYGRNSTGGAINVVTRKPVMGEFGGSVSIDVGDYSLVKASAALNVPLSEKVAARLAVQSIDHDGYLSDGYNDQDMEAARLHVQFEPSDSVSLLLSADYAHRGGQGDNHTPTFRTCGDWCGPSEPSNIALQRVGFFAPIILVVNDDGVGYFDDTFWSVTGDLEADFDIGTLSVIASHRSAEIDSLIYPSLFRGRILDESEQDSLEIRLASHDNSSVSWVAGAYLYKEDVNGSYAYSHGEALQSQINTPIITNEAYAVFGQATWNVGETTRLITGLRYTEDKKDLGGQQECLTGQLCFGGSVQNLSESDSWNDLSYRVGLEWDVAEESMLYATISTAFKSGGFFPASQDATFDPEDLTAYTLGIKSRFSDERVQFNAEVFFWDYEGHQESHVGTACVAVSGDTCVAYGNVFLTENVGKSEIKGIDIDTLFLVGDNGQLGFKIGYLDAEATEFVYNVPATAPPSSAIECTVIPGSPLITVDCSGNSMPRAPEWTARLDYAHQFDLNSGGQVVAQVGSYYSSEYWASISYTPGASQDAFTRSSASLSYYAPEDKWYASLWIDNIEDEPVAATHGTKLFANTSATQLRAPRTYGIRFGFDF